MVSLSYTTFLSNLYGSQTTRLVEPRLRELIERYRNTIVLPLRSDLTEKDAMLITYGDQVLCEGELPLQTLLRFGEQYLSGIISSMHLLPFFPWSSDDGFSVKDYRQVDPALGSWNDVEQLGKRFRMMYDGVINHASVQGEWFQRFLRNETPYRDFFMTVEGDPDLSKVVRPRTLPLITDFSTSIGTRRVWTTFSADQADLDYHNPDVLLEIVDILLGYVQHGAQYLRLDAIAYLWKEVGTTCIHLRQTHLIVQLMRALLEDVAPHVRLITETNVPHQENLSYFGNGYNEAHLIYNFALPPLVLHSFLSGDASTLTDWAAQLKTPSNQTTFFNFLASHDGIGINPVNDILRGKEISALVRSTLAHGGFLSYKRNADGSQSPYEMNINYFDALSDPAGMEPESLQVRRFLTSQAIMLSLRGLPGIYIHSLLGSRNWKEGVALTGKERTINRQKLNLDELEKALHSPGSLRAKVFKGYGKLLVERSKSAAFHPQGAQRILYFGKGIFAVLRISPDGRERMLCLHNVTGETQSAGTHSLPPFATLWVHNPEGYEAYQ